MGGVVCAYAACRLRHASLRVRCSVVVAALCVCMRGAEGEEEEEGGGE